MIIKKRISVLSISKILLTLLIISINLRIPVPFLREFLYFSFICISFIFGNYKKIISVLLLLAIWCISLLYNIFIPGSDAVNGIWFQGIIVSSYLLLLIFSNKKFYKTIINAFIFSAIIISFIIIFLWIICELNDSIKIFLRKYFSSLEESTGLAFISIDTRMILGFHFHYVWYRTAPIILPVLGYFCLQRLKGYKNKKNLFLIIFLTFALTISGQRANLLAASFLFFLYIIVNMYKRKLYFRAFLLLISTLIAGASISYALLNDKGSQSSNVKHLHQVSYFETFETDYVRTLFFGWGYGSTFYTLGRQKYVNITELSHWETIRRYGLVSFIFIMIFIWLKPLINKLKKENGLTKYYYVVVVLAYVFVACTNPFLLDSVGFCVLLFIDAFFEYDTLHRNDNIQRRTLSPRTA